MSGVSSCDRFEREGALKVERGERLGLHYSLCPQCKSAYARYQRLIAALSFADEPEERDALSEDRLLARLSERSHRRWQKIVPLSAFFGFLSLGRRAAAAQKSTALYAFTALTLIGPLPIVMASGGERGEGDPVMVATGVERQSIEMPSLYFASPEAATRSGGSAKATAAGGKKNAEPKNAGADTRAEEQDQYGRAPVGSIDASGAFQLEPRGAALREGAMPERGA